MYVVETSEQIKSILYDKSCTCPLCTSNFTTKTIKMGKNQVLSIEEDLYPHYSMLNPLLYDVIVCPECGYSAVSKNFTTLLSQQKKWLNEIFFKGHNPTKYKEYTSTEEAIKKHKMALLAAIARKGKLNEQAYIALHISWLYRDMDHQAEATLFLKRAYEGYCEAFSKETFPMLGFDEHTLIYLLAALAYKLDNFAESKQYLSMVLTSSNLSPRLKDHAFDLKEKLTQML